MIRLVQQTAGGEETIAELDALQTFAIGRASGNDARFTDPAVSNHHLRLDRTEQGWTLTDLDSANGTTVNGNPVAGTVALAAPATIVLGEAVWLRFVDDTAPASDAAPPPPALLASDADIALVRDMKARTEQIRREVAKVIVGQAEIVEQVLMVLIAGGHGLLVGLPGMAKTTLVATIANVLDMAFRRVQFTPDLMPTDITGTEILESDPESGEKRFRFIRGPVFTNLLLADEINRTPPKTQAALLEAMQEKSVTVGNQTYKLEPPFFVLATQNPIEQEGTYPLPEAQQDRFMFNLWVDYPSEDEEELIVKKTTVAATEKPQKVVSRQELLQLQDVVRKIPVSDHVVRYAVRLVRSTRPADDRAPDFIRKYVINGAGPRAGQFLILAAKARAVLEGRIHVSCADVARAALPVLRHRILSNFAADSEGITPSHLVERLLQHVEQPGEQDY